MKFEEIWRNIYFIIFRTGSSKIIGLSSQETGPFECVEVGEPVASSCLDSSQSNNDFGWRVVRETLLLTMGRTTAIFGLHQLKLPWRNQK